jgi:hypothetical protein
MTNVVTDRMTGRSLVSQELFERLAGRVAADEEVEPGLAERIVDQALAFLGACAIYHDVPLSPSRAVDPGWHAFVLHTRDYREFCHRFAGRFIDHVPTTEASPGAVVDRTVDAIRAAGYQVDENLWASEQAACTQCHNGCHDDPPPQ